MYSQEAMLCVHSMMFVRASFELELGLYAYVVNGTATYRQYVILILRMLVSCI